MKPTSSAIRTGSLFLAIAGFGGLGLFQGCVVSINEVDCTECDNSSLCHNHVGAENQCFCDAGYSDPNPSDDDLGCEPIDPRSGGSQCVQPNSQLQGNFCYCDPGFIWCNGNRDDFTCCEDVTQDSLSGTTWSDPTTADPSATAGDSTSYGTSTSGESTSTGYTDSTTSGTTALPPDPSECVTDYTPACSNADPDAPQGSVYWTCQSGAWIESPDLMEQDCQSSGYDFAYGCYNNYETYTVEFICGDGPGTACTPADDACDDMDTIEYCQFGRLTAASCSEICADPEEAVTYSYGECGVAEDGGVSCFCCDTLDDEGLCVFDEAP